MARARSQKITRLVWACLAASTTFHRAGLKIHARFSLTVWTFLLVVGSSLSYFRAKSQGLRQPAQLIHLDIDSESIGRWYGADVSLIGDAATVLGQLNAALADRPGREERAFGHEVSAVRSKIRAYKRQTMPNETKIMEAIRSVTERDAIFVGDVGVCNHRGANYCLDIYAQRSYIRAGVGRIGLWPAGSRRRQGGRS